jgi:hypothetical protein
MVDFLFNFYLEFRHLVFDDQEFKMKRSRMIDSFFKPRSSSGNGNGENTNAINNNDQHIEVQLTDEQTPNHGTSAPCPEYIAITLADLTKGLVRLGKNSIYLMADRLLRLVITLPISTKTTKRVFSAVKLAKTHTITKMGDGFCGAT